MNTGRLKKGSVFFLNTHMHPYSHIRTKGFVLFAYLNRKVSSMGKVIGLKVCLCPKQISAGSDGSFGKERTGTIEELTKAGYGKILAKFLWGRGKEKFHCSGFINTFSEYIKEVQFLC